MRGLEKLGDIYRSFLIANFRANAVIPPVMTAGHCKHDKALVAIAHPLLQTICSAAPNMLFSAYSQAEPARPRFP